MSVYQYEIKKNTEEKRNRIRWYFLVRYKDWKGNTKQRKQMGYLTKEDCKKGEKEFLDSIKTNNEIPFNELYKKYITYCVKILNLKKTSLLTKENIFEHHILPFFEKTPLCNISKQMIMEFFSNLSNQSFRDKGKDLSPSYKKTIKVQLNSIMNYGKEFFGLEKNNCNGIKIGSDNSVREEVWKTEDFNKFIKYFDNDLMNKTIFTLLWSSGMREGELLGLQLRDFDFENNCVSIVRNYQFNGKEYEYTTPKTDSSIRTISLPKITMELVKKYSNSLFDLNETDRLFVTSKSCLLSYMTKGSKETNVNRIPIHSIRHSFITNMINKGVSPKTVSVMVGHKNVKTTLNIYTHCNCDNQKTVSNILDNELEGIVI